MKTRLKTSTLEEVMAIKPYPHKPPRRPSRLMQTAVRTLGASELRSVKFRCHPGDMKGVRPQEPCLVLMNHSAFIDLKIAAKVLYPRPYNIVCTSDGFVGKEALLRSIGCIPTPKFVTDTTLIRDMLYCLNDLQSSVLLYPEASYSFDGTATPLPESMGKLLKLLKVPVLMIRTHGAFLHDPLYNGLKLRRTHVHADFYCLYSREEVAEKSVEALNKGLAEAFTFDNFREQQEEHIRVTEPFRAEGLERVLYRCPICGVEGRMYSQGEHLHCGCCHQDWWLNPEGRLEVKSGEQPFWHIPDWYRWERREVARELEEGRYLFEEACQIRVLRDMEAIYEVGRGILRHSAEGFVLTAEDGRELFKAKPQANYSVYSDYFWYELGDMVCIGDREMLFYCFPERPVPVAKVRLAAEELYRMTREKRKDKQTADV